MSDKRAVSVYGLGRFPVTLYYEQWLKLLGAAEDLRAFLEENNPRLKLKDDARIAELERQAGRASSSSLVGSLIRIHTNLYQITIRILCAIA